MSDSKAREAAARAAFTANQRYLPPARVPLSEGQPTGNKYYEHIVNAAIDAYIAALKAEGYAVMPREAYNAMWNVGDDMMPSADELVAGIEEYGEDVFYEVMPGPGKIWTAMFDAYKEDEAPTPPAETPTGRT